MRCLDRDRRWVLVSLYEGKEPEVDAEGRITGRHVVKRSEPFAVLASVSAAKGTAQDSVFGQALDYDRTVIVDDPGIDVAETSVLWVDCVDGRSAEPPEASEADGGYDYVVKRVARTPSYTAMAVKRVERP